MGLAPYAPEVEAQMRNFYAAYRKRTAAAMRQLTRYSY